jgi:hypothetical protein
MKPWRDIPNHYPMFNNAKYHINEMLARSEVSIANQNIIK